jgi:hypothetical protein
MEKKISPKGEHNKLNYDERIKNYVDFSEQRFEEYCQRHKYFYRKLHLNQSDDIFSCPIPHWNRLGLLTSMPDYFVYNDREQIFVEVKASNKLKTKDLKSYIAWEKMFCDPKYTKYRIAFCFNDKIVMKTTDQILELLPQSKLSSYHEGNKYYILPI